MKIILPDLPAQDAQVPEMNRRMEAGQCQHTCRVQGTHEC